MHARYMDDIFTVFGNDNACMLVLKALNNQHQNISCLIEKSRSTLQFLNIIVQINDKGVDTWPTNTGLFLNFEAVCSLQWKCGLILCMLHRAKMICSNDTQFLKEVN